MGVYEDSESWTDIVPIPQNEGGPHPLAAIAYTDEYSEAMSYLRAVMAVNEMSARVLELTEHIIRLNPAHYTVWLYRAKVVEALERDLLEELQWLNAISLKYLKNYQIWHHRLLIMSQIPSLPPDELPFLVKMLAKDAKNYHVWSYRQWLVRHFSLWAANPNSSEIEYIETLLRDDVRNNSAWNHRWFVVFGGPDDLPVERDVWEREISFAKDNIRKAPQNQSGWLYMRGVLRRKGDGLKQLEEFAGEFADVENANGVKSSHALDLLAHIWAEEQEGKKAEKALLLLAARYDPIRKNYWDYRRELLGLPKVTVEV